MHCDPCSVWNPMNFYFWQDSAKDAFQSQKSGTEYECHEFPCANCQKWVWLPKIKVCTIHANFQLWQDPAKVTCIDPLTSHSLLIPHLATTTTAHTPLSGQTSTSPGPRLHPRPTNLKTLSIQSLSMQTSIFSIMNKVNLDVCTNPPPPPHLSSMVMMSLANCTKKHCPHPLHNWPLGTI